MIGLLYLLFCKPNVFRRKMKLWIGGIVDKLMKMLSKNTLGIYLWHIFYKVFCAHYFDLWWVQYLFVLLCSIITAIVQNKIADTFDIVTRSKLKVFSGIFRG